MTFLPIVERELREASRRRAAVWVRLGFAVLGVVVVGGALMFLGGAARPGGGEGVFRFMVWLLFGYGLVAGVFLTADSLSGERREGTLGLMFLTDLRGYDVVLGRLVGRSLTAVYGMMAVMPVLGAAILLGGVGFGEFGACVLACLNALFLSMAVGLLVSSCVRDDQVALWGAGGVVLILAAALPIWVTWVGAGGGWEWLLVMSPWAGVRAGMEAGGAGMPSWGEVMMGVHALGWACLAGACLVLPRVWRETGKGRVVAEWFRGGERRMALPEGPAWGAVEWMALRVWLVGWRGLWLGVVVGGGVLVAMDLAMVHHEFHWTRVVLGFGVKGLVAVQSARVLAGWRREGLLELVMGTGVSGGDVVRGVWRALVRRFLGVGVLLAVLELMSMGLMVGAWTWGGMTMDGGFDAAFSVVGGAYRALLVLVELAMAAWVGILMGLVVRQERWVPVWAVVFAVVLPGVVSMVVFCLPRLLLDAVVLSAARGRVAVEVRRLGKG